MRVVIDGLNLGLEQGTGISTYSRNLSYGLRDLGHEVGVLYDTPWAGPKEPLLNEIYFFDPLPPRRKFGRRWNRLSAMAGGLFHLPRLPLQARSIATDGHVVRRGFEARMPHFDRLYTVPELFDRAHFHFKFLNAFTRVKFSPEVDIAHWTMPLPIYAPGALNIYTIHDLIPVKLPYTTLDSKRHYLRMLRWVAQCADLLIAVSESSRRDAIDLLGVDPQRIVTTYQAITVPPVYSEAPDDTVAQILKGTFYLDFKKYLLFVGAIEPKKNLGRLIDAFLATGLDMPLVIAGARAWKFEKELALVGNDQLRELYRGERDGRGRRIMMLDYVSFPHLMWLLRGARALLFPSLYEGFGLPVLEAMSLGSPVMTSRVASLPEVAGEAALLVDPYRTDQMRDAIAALATDDALAARLSAAGRLQAARFSFDIYRQRLEAAYAACLARAAAGGRAAGGGAHLPRAT